VWGIRQLGQAVITGMVADLGADSARVFGLALRVQVGKPAL
jgi:hypothetical protein